MKRAARILCLVLVLGCLGATAWPGRAHAHGNYDAFLLIFADLLETPFPDLRYRLDRGDADAGLTLSWPVVLDWQLVDQPKALSVSLLPFVEPQLLLPDVDFRILGGGRLTAAYNLGLLVEGGGLYGREGGGSFYGAGVTWRREWAGFWPSISLVYRWYQEGELRSEDLCLDLTVPLPVNGGF